WRRRSPRYRAGAAARDAFLTALNRTASQKRIKALMERGFHRPGDVENRLGFVRRIEKARGASRVDNIPSQGLLRCGISTRPMSALCQSRPNALQQKGSLFDHVVGNREHPIRNR